MNILIIGGSGGIGLSVLKDCLRHYPDADVIATYHDRNIDFQHPRLQWRRLDVTSESDIQAFSQSTPPLNIIINAVGFLHSDIHRPEKSIQEFNCELFEKNISLNTLPSILIAKYFEKSLKAAKGNTFYIVLSARIGSIKDNNVGGWISYRISKAALNMAMKTISIEWKYKLPRCCILLFHPGTTDTQFSKPFQKNLPKHQVHSSAVTSESLLMLIKKSTPSDTGQFISFDGTEIDW